MKTERITMLALTLVGTQYALSAAPKTEQRPNVLFCIADDASFHHFSVAKCPWVKTPNIDKIASNGLFFERCYTPNAKSAPSRAIILTGRYSWQLGEAGNHISNFPADVKVFTEALSESGYDVAYTGKGWAPGNPGVVDGKPRELTGREYNDKLCETPTTCMGGIDYAQNFSDFLSENKKSKEPWFFWFGSYEPHRAYEYGTGVRLGGKSVDDIDHVPAFWPDNDIVRNDMLDYALEVEEYDKQVGEALAALEASGQLDNTIIIITSDNGMPFPRSKANNYEYSNHMPFVMQWPAGIKNPGRSVGEYVSFTDIAPTVLDLCSVAPSKYDVGTLAGGSISSILYDNVSESESERRSRMVLGRERDDYGRPNNEGYPIRAIIENDVLYIQNMRPERYPAGNALTGYLDVDGSPTKSFILDQHRTNKERYFFGLSFAKRPAEELYDLKRDLDCVNNLADDPNYAELKSSLQAKLLSERERTDDPRLGTNGDIFDSYPYQSEAFWNFYESVESGEVSEPWNQTGWVTPSDYQFHPSNVK